MIHDFTVEKTTNGRGRVASMTRTELAVLDAGSHFGPQFAGVRIPTLAEVFDLVGNRCRVNIEIKSEDVYARDASDGVAAFIRRRALYEQVIVSSFNPITLIKVRALDPRIALGFLYDAEMPALFRPIWAGPPMHPEAQHPDYVLVDEAYMTWARKIGANVNVWTVNAVADAVRLAELGVDVIMTDLPDKIIAGLGGQHG
ncbi:MAG: hypothetical protein IPK16_06115 [Anaerolineales bacterium]|nr:hypothetical protein [Anaerolineales bacterium]